ncbi:hypothetical protein Rhe02_97910 [Rhizocola hellebori]|uniref:RDD family protein n=1 Tax=Rhizocola hellebori TaxID=1392758 RepID=A0A8J3VLV0_9ACTN|nr:RDD family protein [Rhizocola hellebori]GIH11724.1 hypothetical protein Rhe02_97910 [Rhizocola hellebori]
MTSNPGWYKDPAEPTTQRYWDGEGWLGASLPVTAIPPEGPLPLPPPPPAEPPAPAPGQVPPPPSGIPYRMLPQARPHGMILASPGARLVARMIDIALILLLNVLINGWFVYQWLTHAIPYMSKIMQALYDNQPVTEITRPADMDNLLLVIALIFAALWLIYEVPATARGGQTVGKRAARIKVVRMESEEPLGFPRSLWRWSFMGLPILLLGCCGPFFIALQMADVFWVAVDRVQRMALHDRSAATYVVKLPGAPRQKGK